MTHNISIGFLDDGDCSTAEFTDGDSDFTGNSKIRAERISFPIMIMELIECGNGRPLACTSTLTLQKIHYLGLSSSNTRIG